MKKAITLLVLLAMFLGGGGCFLYAYPDNPKSKIILNTLGPLWERAKTSLAKFHVYLPSFPIKSADKAGHNSLAKNESNKDDAHHAGHVLDVKLEGGEKSHSDLKVVFPSKSTKSDEIPKKTKDSGSTIPQVTKYFYDIPPTVCFLASEPMLYVVVAVQLQYSNPKLREEIQFRESHAQALIQNLFLNRKIKELEVPKLRQDIVKEINRILPKGGIQDVNFKDFKVETKHDSQHNSNEDLRDQSRARTAPHPSHH